MPPTTTPREVWWPRTDAERDAVAAELRSILASPHFSNSKRYPAFLRYVVEAALAGKADLLKERTIGVEVFDRPASYDTSADTVVRYTAGEVRKRLAIYYHDLGGDPPVQIVLPPGSYIPQFLIAVEHAPLEDLNGQHGSFLVHAGVQEADEDTEALQLPNVVSGRRQLPTDANRWLVLAGAVLMVLAISFAGWKYRSLHQASALDQFALECPKRI